MMDFLLILIALGVVISFHFYEKYKIQKEVSIQRLMEKKRLEQDLEKYTNVLNALKYTDDRSRDSILYSINGGPKKDLSEGIQKIRITKHGNWQIFKVSRKGSTKLADSEVDNIKIWSNGRRIK